MGPVPGALAHNAGALLIVLNSARLLKWRYRDDPADTAGNAISRSVPSGQAA